MIPLPPKRFERYEDPKFDPIRPKRWFGRLEQRRSDPERLAGAIAALSSSRRSIPSVAEEWGVNAVDLTYGRFFAEGRSRVASLPKNERKAVQMALDEAYLTYCLARGDTPFNECLTRAATRLSLSPDKLVDLWETDPLLFPTNYRKD